MARRLLCRIAMNNTPLQDVLRPPGWGVAYRFTWIVAAILGAALTLSTMHTGFCLLAGLRGCRTTVSDEQRVRAIGAGAQIFLLDRDRCPRNTDELVASGYVSRLVKRLPYPEVQIRCNPSNDVRTVTVVSPGRDSRFGTRDDVTSLP
jgi:hypothetical protein